MAEERPDPLAEAFANYLIQTNPPGERPQVDSPRWRDLRGAFVAGARYGTEALGQ